MKRRRSPSTKPSAKPRTKVTKLAAVAAVAAVVAEPKLDAKLVDPDAIDHDFICVICHSVYFEAVRICASTPSHHMCREHSADMKSSTKCPVCKTSMLPQPFPPPTDPIVLMTTSAAAMLKNPYLAAATRECRDCKIEVKVTDYAIHVAETCPTLAMTCKDCGIKLSPREWMDTNHRYTEHVESAKERFESIEIGHRFPVRCRIKTTLYDGIVSAMAKFPNLPQGATTWRFGLEEVRMELSLFVSDELAFMASSMDDEEVEFSQWVTVGDAWACASPDWTLSVKEDSKGAKVALVHSKYRVEGWLGMTHIVVSIPDNKSLKVLVIEATKKAVENPVTTQIGSCIDGDDQSLIVSNGMTVHFFSGPSSITEVIWNGERGKVHTKKEWKFCLPPEMKIARNRAFFADGSVWMHMQDASTYVHVTPDLLCEKYRVRDDVEIESGWNHVMAAKDNGSIAVITMAGTSVAHKALVNKYFQSLGLIKLRLSDIDS